MGPPPAVGGPPPPRPPRPSRSLILSPTRLISPRKAPDSFERNEFATSPVLSWPSMRSAVPVSSCPTLVPIACFRCSTKGVICSAGMIVLDRSPNPALTDFLNPSTGRSEVSICWPRRGVAWAAMARPKEWLWDLSWARFLAS